MKMNGVEIKNVDEYIAGFPSSTQKLLQQLRSAIRKAAPQAEETISYQMPAYKFNGSVVYFGGYNNHIGFYPTAAGIANFKNDLASFKTSKGAVQFPIGKPMPLQLVSKIVKSRMEENRKKAALKAAMKKQSA